MRISDWSSDVCSSDLRGEEGTTTYLESGALDAWVAYLARRGVRFDQMPKDEEWGWREARLADPAGNRLCLYQAAEYRRYPPRSEEHTSELQSLMRISYAVFFLKQTKA